MRISYRLLSVLGIGCLWLNAAHGAASSGQIEARLVITNGCEVSQGSRVDKPTVSCAASPASPGQFTTSIAEDTGADGRPRQWITLTW